MLAITLKQLLILAGIFITLLVIWIWSAPVRPDEDYDKFNPYREDHEEGYDADYEPKKWGYDHMN